MKKTNEQFNIVNEAELPIEPTFGDNERQNYVDGDNYAVAWRNLNGSLVNRNGRWYRIDSERSSFFNGKLQGVTLTDVKSPGKALRISNKEERRAAAEERWAGTKVANRPVLRFIFQGYLTLFATFGTVGAIIIIAAIILVLL